MAYSYRVKRSRDLGFTLIELLVVMGIMVMMLGIGVAGFYGMRRGAEMRGAVATVRTTLMLARQHAVTKRRAVTVRFVPGATNLMELTRSGSTNVYRYAYLSPGIEFATTPNAVTFYPSAGGGGSESIILQERQGLVQGGGSASVVTVLVWRLTGITKVQEP